MPSRRTVLITVFDDVDLLDVAGPSEVFAIADRLLGGGGYELVLAAPHRGRVTTFSGLPLQADLSFDEVTGPVDTLLVPGGVRLDRGRVEPVVDPVVVEAVGRIAAVARRVAAVCTGAHVLAAAGLLEGRRATTHWATADRLAQEHPDVRVDAERIYLQDGNIWTSAGLSSGMDLALAMVADDHGDDVARTVARWLVVYLRRPGSQSQYSVPLAQETHTPGPVRELQRWLVEHLYEDLSVPALASRMSMSVRHFSRVFAQETGRGPAEHVAALRREAARRRLEQTDLPLETIARECGYGSVDALHRAFRASGTTPAAHRARFRSSGREVARA
jgi:transcriptional regulator GlxA family with amidase domain